MRAHDSKGDSAMKAALIRRFGGYEVFEYTDVPEPQVEPDHAIVKVLGCGINRYDLFLRMGGIKKDTPLPHVMGADIAGEVVQINAAIEDHLEILARDPWNEGWLIRVKPASKSLEGMMDASAYEEFVSKEE